jgi:hypothetical protein
VHEEQQRPRDAESNYSSERLIEATLEGQYKMDGKGYPGHGPHQNKGGFGAYQEEEEYDQGSFGQQPPVPNTSHPGNRQAYHPGGFALAPPFSYSFSGPNVPHLGQYNQGQNLHGIHANYDPNYNMGRTTIDPLANALAAEIYNNNYPFISDQSMTMNSFGVSSQPPSNTQHLAIQQQVPHNFQPMTSNIPYNQSGHPTMNSGQFSGHGFAQPFVNRIAGFQPQHLVSPSAVSAPLATLPSQNNDSVQDSELDEEYFDPDTGRRLRDFLGHEKTLLRTFYHLKHRSSPVPSYHEARIWQINMSSSLLDEWNNFLLAKQSKREAVDRADAVKDYQEMITALKNRERAKTRSDKRGNEFGKPGRKKGTKNKPKTSTPVKGAYVGKKATPRKSANVLKGTQSSVQQSSSKYTQFSNFSFFGDHF